MPAQPCRTLPQRALGPRILIAVACFSLSGCMRWAPLAPGFAGGDYRQLGRVRIGGPEGTELERAQIQWPTLMFEDGGQPRAIDVRLYPVERRVVSAAGIVTLVVASFVTVLVTAMVSTVLYNSNTAGSR